LVELLRSPAQWTCCLVSRAALWLAQRLIIPHDLQGYPLQVILRLALTWWAEAAQIFVNGVAVQEGDLFDCSTRVLLSPSVTSGEEITTLRLVSPSHDDGALVRSMYMNQPVMLASIPVLLLMN